MESVENIQRFVDLAEFQHNRARKLYRDISELQVNIIIIKDDSVDSRCTSVLESTYSWIVYFLGEIELELEILESHTASLHNWLQRTRNLTNEASP